MSAYFSFLFLCLFCIWSIRNKDDFNFCYHALKKKKKKTTNSQLNKHMCKSLQKVLTKKAQQQHQQLRKFETVNLNQQHKLSWKPLNEMRKRKRTKSGNVKRKTKEERVKGRYTNIKELLGNPSVLAY